ncbi:terminase [Fibrella sp. ES10-3-2-2]|nr:terminase [Fibrella sp. ES10-3-2-2]
MPAPAGNSYSPGRPSDYQPAYDEQARKLCLLGATDEELADFFQIAESTLYKWKNEHPSFSDSIQRGKIIADAEIAESLYNRAKGYSHPDTHFSTYEGEVTATDTVKHYPPDTQAASLWLRNRQPKKWRDSKEIVVDDKGGSKLKAWTAEEIDAFEAFQKQGSDGSGN